VVSRAHLARIRFGWLLVALIAGMGLALVVGGSPALGDQVCTTTGDVSLCVDWTYFSNETGLAVSNTASSGGQTISSFTFQVPGAGFDGTKGDASCMADSSASSVSCSNPTTPGSTQSVAMLAQNPPAIGASGTLTVTDSTGHSQPPITVTLQPPPCFNPAKGCHPPTTTTTTTSTATSTTTTVTPPPTECTAALDISKSLTTVRIDDKYLLYHSQNLHETFVSNAVTNQKVDGGKFRGGMYYEIEVTNTSDCTAIELVIDDFLPVAFHCGGAEIFGRPKYPGAPKGSVRCAGDGASILKHVATLPPHRTVWVFAFGGFVHKGTNSNLARAFAANARATKSHTVHVDVVTARRFRQLRAGRSSGSSALSG
jgi:hypothetical protein